MFKDESPKSLTPTLSLIRERELSLFSPLPDQGEGKVRV
jgi:hypothetical protein